VKNLQDNTHRKNKAEPSEEMNPEQKRKVSQRENKDSSTYR
jgi:hypothetical protein